MLQKLGDHIHGWIAGIVVVIISIAFIAFGVTSYLQGKSPAQAVVAKVNGKTLVAQNLSQQYNKAIQSDPTLALASPEKILAKKKELMQQWVRQQAIQTSLHDAGMLVSPEMVRDFLVSLPTFQMNGAFSNYLFNMFMQQQGFNSEQQVYDVFSNQLATMSFVQAISQSAFVTPQVIQRYFLLLTQQRSFRYSLLPISDYMAQVKVTDAALQAYYQKHIADFRAPETVSVDYIELSPSDLASQVQISPAAVKDYYQKHMQEFTTPATWKIATFSMSDLRSKYLKETNEQLNKRFADQVAALEAGKNIKAFLQAHKPITLNANTINSQLKQVLTGLKPGQVSKVQNNDLLKGETVYYMVEATPQKVTSFANAQQKIMANLQKNQINQIFSAKSNQMVYLADSNPESLSAVAKGIGLPIQTTPAFTRQGLKNGPASSTKFIEAAYGDIVLSQGMNSDPVNLADGSIVIMHLHKHTLAYNKPYAVVKNAAQTDYVQQQAQQLATQHADELSASLNQNKNVMVSWKNVPMATVGDKSLPEVIATAVFDKPFAVNAKPVAFVVPMDSQNIALVQLQALHLMPLSSLTAKQSDSIKERLMKFQQNAELTMMQNSLYNHSKIKTYPQNIS